MAFEAPSQGGLKLLLCVHLLNVFHLVLPKKKGMYSLSDLMAVCRHLFGHLFQVEGHLRGTKVPSHQSPQGDEAEKKPVKEMYRLNMPFKCRLSVPTSHAFQLFPSFPTWLRQRGVSICYRFFHAFPGYSGTSLSPSVPVFLFPLLFHLPLFALIPLSIPTHLSWPPCRVRLQLACH